MNASRKSAKAPPNLAQTRQSIYHAIEKERGSRVLAFVTGDRPNMQTQIADDSVDLFSDFLDPIFPTRKISLVLYTLGGSTMAAWNLVNLLRMFCDELELIVPHKARSAGTLICLGADRIVMTKQATLGPIDPSLNGPLNPQIPGGAPDARAPVSVEAVKGFIEMAKRDFGVQRGEDMTRVLCDLANKVHPLVLGAIFRTRSQIQFLAQQLLRTQVQDEAKKKSIVDFLCSDSGSHDYTINRREAKSLGLNIDKPNDNLYGLLKAWLANVRQELELAVPFDVNAMLGSNASVQYTCRRCLVEGTATPSRYFVSEGMLTRVTIPTPHGQQDAINDSRTFEGWR